MFIKDLKKIMLLPKKEIFINKTVKIREIDVKLVSITLEEHRNVLWVMYQSPCCINEEIEVEERMEHITNRDEIINNINKEMNSCHIYISEITIQNQKMTFSSSSAGLMYTTNYEGYMQMQHFIENGLDTTSWNEVDLSNIVIAAYVQDENEEFPSIDLSKELDITLKISKDSKQVLINQSIDLIKLEFGQMEKDTKFNFYDDISKKNRIFYINEIKHHDIWEEVNNKFEDEWAKTLPKEQLESMKENFISSLEGVCPKGMDLALLEYETEDNIQLNFYSKEYLDKKLVYNDSASAMGVFFSPDEEFGINGFKNRICMIKPVEKDFNGSLEIELLSWYREIPEEIITV